MITNVKTKRTYLMGSVSVFLNNNTRWDTVSLDVSSASHGCRSECHWCVSIIYYIIRFVRRNYIIIIPPILHKSLTVRLCLHTRQHSHACARIDSWEKKMTKYHIECYIMLYQKQKKILRRITLRGVYTRYNDIIWRKLWPVYYIVYFCKYIFSSFFIIVIIIHIVIWRIIRIQVRHLFFSPCVRVDRNFDNIFREKLLPLGTPTTSLGLRLSLCLSLLV